MLIMTAAVATPPVRDPSGMFLTVTYILGLRPCVADPGLPGRSSRVIWYDPLIPVPVLVKVSPIFVLGNEQV